MKSVLLFISILLFASIAYAQSANIKKEIDDQVWKPFMSSFKNFDSEGFMAVHSRDVMRVLQDNGGIMNYDQYYASNKRGNSGKANKRKRDIELRFIKRIASNDQAFEIGYYKTTSIRSDGTSNSFYGKFHVALKKENGIWKILLDTDTSQGVTEQQFLAASPIE